MIRWMFLFLILCVGCSYTKLKVYKYPCQIMSCDGLEESAFTECLAYNEKCYDKISAGANQ